MNPFKKSGKSVSIFITAGYPGKESLPEQLLFLQNQGIDFVEIGIPFSDPMADGPVIQETSSIALKNGMTLSLLFEQLESIRGQVNIPLVLMGYLNPILQYGLENFIRKCDHLKLSGLIIPDLSFELVEKKYTAVFNTCQIPLIYLITPQTSDTRIREILTMSSKGFIYLVGQNKITGSSYSLLQQTSRYKELKLLCGEIPLFIGFGIQTSQQKREAFRVVDGIIVGTAYLSALSKNEEHEFIEKLLS